jgi:hypothetical protein
VGEGRGTGQAVDIHLVPPVEAGKPAGIARDIVAGTAAVAGMAVYA